MRELLADLEKAWKEIDIYKDVKAILFETKEKEETHCPNGCALELYETTKSGWGRIENRDAFRRTKFCREHGFARIYVISGPDALRRKMKM